MSPPASEPADKAASSTPPVAAEPRASANAGTATCTIPTAVPNATSAPNTVRMPGAPSGPSQPTSCGVPRHARDGPVAVNASADPTLSPPATTTATVGDHSAAIPAASAGAVTTATSNTTATSA